MLLFATFGSTWGKVVADDLVKKESLGASEELEMMEPLGNSSDLHGNPCMYKGKIFTIDVRKIASRLTLWQ